MKFFENSKKKKIEAAFIEAEIAMVLEEGNEFEVLKKCIDEWPECVKFSDESNTLLHTAAAHGTPEMIEYIVAKGGGIHINCIKKEWTPICWAITKNKIENVRKLIELGAELNNKDSVNNSVIMAIGHNPEILRLLIQKGADITYQYKTKDNVWWNALTFAMYRHEEEAVEIIKEELHRLHIDTTEDEELFRKNLENEKKSAELDVDYGEYIEEHLGEIGWVYEDEEILDVFWDGERQVEDDTEIAIYGILPKDKSYAILVTAGMSEYPMAETDEGLQYAEVMMKIPRVWMEDNNLIEDEDHNWTLRILSKAAYLGHAFEGAYIDESVIVPCGTPDVPSWFDWDYEFSAVMLCKSEDIPMLQTDEETKVKFYTLIPITEEEKALVNEKGSEEVKKMLSCGDVVDMERPLLVEPEE